METFDATSTPSIDDRVIVRLHALPIGRTVRMVGIADEGQSRPPGAPPITDFSCAVDESGAVHRREIVKRLCDLGLTPGTVFKKIQGHAHGPVLIEVRDTKLAIGQGLARKILVEEVVEE